MGDPIPESSRAQAADAHQRTRTRFISVFGLGCGANTLYRGPLARQMTDDLAVALSTFPTISARPHHLLAADDDQVDPTLIEGAGFDQIKQGVTPRLKFIIFSTLPADSTVRTLGANAGVTLALSGRLVIEGGDVDLALNLWDIGPPNLLWCRVAFGPLETLPTMLIDAAAHLAHRLEDPEAEDLEAASAKVGAALGTRSMPAYDAFAQVTDKFRRQALNPTGGMAHFTIPAGLVSALEHDRDYVAPRLLLVEHALARLQRGDKDYAQALCRALQRVGDPPRIALELLRFEAALLIEDRQQAGAVLRDLRARFGRNPTFDAAQARFERSGG